MQYNNSVGQHFHICSSAHCTHPADCSSSMVRGTTCIPTVQQTTHKGWHYWGRQQPFRCCQTKKGQRYDSEGSCVDFSGAQTTRIKKCGLVKLNSRFSVIFCIVISLFYHIYHSMWCASVHLHRNNDFHHPYRLLYFSTHCKTHAHT